MPANVRNFWGKVYIPGRAKELTFGPKAKEDGFTLTFNIRQDGAISDDELYLDGIVHDNGTLSIKASTKKGGMIGTLLTGRR